MMQTTTFLFFACVKFQKVEGETFCNATNGTDDIRNNTPFTLCVSFPLHKHGIRKSGRNMEALMLFNSGEAGF